MSDNSNAGSAIPANNGSGSGDYDASKIQVMEGLEAVRKRPGMYIGDTHSTGLHHLVYEIVDNSIDEALAGYCDEINVKIHSDGSVSVVDNGRGIPVDIHPKYNKPALEIVMTILHAGGKFDANSYKVSGGLHGVGMHVVNALSERLDVRVKRGGKTYFQHYEIGKPKTSLSIVEENVQGTGTAIHFMPDKTIFETTVYDYDILAARLRDLSYLNRGVKIILSDERQSALDAEGKPKQDVFQSSGGISEFVAYINKNKTAFHPVISFFGKSEGVKVPVEVEIAMQYTTEYSENILTFVNNINTREGGTHLVGLKAALTRTINDYAKKNNMLKGEDALQGDDVREGLTAIMTVKMHEPQFEGQTKMKLGNSEVKGIVEALTNEKLGQYFEEHPLEAKNIIQKSVQAFYAREAARKARELARRKTVFGSGGLPGKLADCSNSEPSKCEIYIVEGDSAGGSAKQGRNREFQAILPLRGKILNVEKARIDKVFENAEIQALATAIGTGVGEEFDIAKARYHKIIIMCDADVDGAHIRTLLLTFFFRYMRQLIDSGYVYIAQPPLYRIAKGKIVRYAYSDEEKDRIYKEIGGEVSRYKGLGEMNPEQLWETTMDPANRCVLKVDVEDAALADRLFTILMGEEVEPRKEFIYAHAKEVTNLDI
ncbi:MAG: DNA topoisomerase (ATP-hydrolyzing) subunit B [Candidatus Thermoplasmatota archaeon]|nr:DNA topoisomerase (ATP-hydrolyzing) subunit B [Candidatus Thermoplasmatota archaeon]